MIKKITYLGVMGLLFLTTISCEKDFTDVGSTIIKNDKFNTKTVEFDVELTQNNVTAVNAGNTEIANLGEYLLGVYKKENAKTLQAGIVSQLIIPSLSTKEKIKKEANLKDGEFISEPILDKVILKIPVQATLKNSKFKIDSLLGNPNKSFSVNVYRNLTFLNTLNPQKPSEKLTYLSNKKYDKESTKLNKQTAINFSNLAKDTLFIFNRTLSNKVTFKDTLKVVNNTKANPFIVIELDKEVFKKAIFDKYLNKDNKIALELSSQDAFNNYFRGIIIEAIGDDGAMIPLTTAVGTLKPSVDFIHTSTIKDKNGVPLKDSKSNYRVVEKTDSFYFGGITNSIYNMSGDALLANNIVLQGTAGTVATVKILEKDSDNNGISDLEELRKKQILINNASLVFDINTTVADSLKTPKRLFLFKNEKDKLGNILPTKISGLYYTQSDVTNGKLNLEEEKPDNYAFNIRYHISEIIAGKSSNSELSLRIFNTTDVIANNSGDSSVKNYNWNPRSVSLLNNSTKGGKRGAKLTIFYTEKK